LNPADPPGSNFDLSHWKLQLPVDSSGGTNGSPQEIAAAQLTGGYTNAYFYTGTDGAMVFWAPVWGVPTSGSSYPRSELREMVSPTDDTSNWLAYGTHILNVQCKVLQVPATGKVIIGQIHGYTGAALPLVKIYFNSNSALTGTIKTNANNDSSDKTFDYSPSVLSNTITYQIQVVNGFVSVTVNGVTNSLNVFQTDPNWATNTVYFKAGDYCQDNSGATIDGARVALYSLSAYHAPSITNLSSNQSVFSGSNATFAVSAAGNGRLSYEWWFNATNTLPGATSASLTLTNAQTANTGGYTVVVNDSLGSVTSSVVALTVIGPVSAPVFDPPAGAYTASQSVTISTATTGASIRYTADGTIPTSNSGTLYSQAVMVSSNQTLKAIAYKSGMPDSALASGAYTILMRPQITSSTLSGANLVITFTAAPSDLPSQFTLVASTNCSTPITNPAAATIVGINPPGTFQATTPVSAAMAFYRVMR
jgi:hypothetical protein